MKFVIVGDVHFKGTNPRARLDNYMEAIASKLLEVFEIARRVGAEAIIQTGDLLDSPSTTFGVVAELASILQQAPCPVLAIHGNHDVWAGSAESKHRTPFGLLARLGIVQDVEDRPFERLVEEVYVTGHGFTAETDTEAGRGQYEPPVPVYVDGDGKPFRIHVVHSNLMDKAPGFDMRHTLISQVRTTADVVVCGHLHTGFGRSYVARREDGVLFVNPGALCRLSASVEEMERTVQVGLLTVGQGGQGTRAHVDRIPLKSALPGHMVLSREHIEAEQERSGRLDKFLSLLASEGESRFLEVREIVEDIAARESIPEDVKKEALKRIGTAREVLGKGEM